MSVQSENTSDITEKSTESSLEGLLTLLCRKEVETIRDQKDMLNWTRQSTFQAVCQKLRAPEGPAWTTLRPPAGFTQDLSL